jgi:hypothetical protein
MNQSTIANTILWALTLLVIGVIISVAFIRVDRFLDLKAINDCAMEYKLSYFDQKTNTTITRPLDKPFEQCINNKGVTNWKGIK